MKTIDLATEKAGIDEILHLAEDQNLFVRAADGKVFVVAEVDTDDIRDDFANELALTRHNQALRELLAERSQEPGKYTTDQVRQKLGSPPAAKNSGPT
jgi:hypothetical protein